MPNAPEPGRDRTGFRGKPGSQRDPGETQNPPPASGEAETETLKLAKQQPVAASEPAEAEEPERRFTAPGFDEKETQVIATAPEAATEAFQTQPPAAQPTPPAKAAVPQSIPGRTGGKASFKNRNWGWVLAIVVIVLALAAIAIFGTVLLTRKDHPKASQEDQVKQTIQNFDIAIQRGDLTALRSITCGTTRDGYVEYDEKAWSETYRRVSAAKQFPVIANIDQVVVNGQHAEANITTFMAYDPQTRSTRSLDLQFRDDQWKICQSS